ncbi:DNA glycosylase [Artemisia annua]|uniref:DNA glycosylase n=1 Tax=Artemisia annua TaxID=35608 RepID=A0A2U1LD87_ARTAN|nr:DNA glycosylase [Artemisia annua]
MCSSNSKLLQSNDVTTPTTTTTTLSDINGRLVLQPASPNRNSPLFERRSLKKTLSLPKTITMTPSHTTNIKTNQPPISPKLKSPRQPATKREMTTSSDKLVLPLPTKCTTPKSVVKKSKNCSTTSGDHDHILHTSVDASVDSPGSIAAARREQVAVMQVQRKMRIAHYGRSKSAKYDNGSKLTSYSFDPNSLTLGVVKEEKRCSFITLNSDPIYVAYHDEEWGVPAHDDKRLFELLAITGAQVGSDWTSVLKKRKQFREAFSGFDAEIVSKYSEKKITSISSEYGIEVSLVRGVVDNSKSIIEINKSFGSFNNYIWGFVNHKPIVTQYKSSHKMPVKTSKAEGISKDMVRRGFRQVGPTVIHSFMQAAGLTNDHLTTCPRHHQCVALASPTSTTPNPMIPAN